jgi:hypothetical protein
MARRSWYGDDDAFGRGTHKAGVSAQIEAGLVRFKTRKDHRRLAVRAEGTLAGSFAMEKRRHGTIEHNTLPLVRRERNSLSVTDSCLGRGGDGITMRFGVTETLVNIAHSWNFFSGVNNHRRAERFLDKPAVGSKRHIAVLDGPREQFFCRPRLFQTIHE